MSVILRYISLGALTAVLLVMGLGKFYGNVDPVVADEKFQTIHIFPAEVISDDWEGPDLAKIQELPDDAIFQLFNPSNSAYIASDEYLQNYSVILSASGSAAPSTEEKQESSPVPKTTSEGPDPEPSSLPVPELEPEVDDGDKPEDEERSVPEQLDTGEPPVSQPESASEPTIQESPSLPPSEPISPPPEASSPPPPEPPPPEAPPPPEETTLRDTRSSVFSFYKNIKWMLFNGAIAQEASPSFQEEISFSCDGEDVKCLSRNIEFGGFGVGDAFEGQPIRNIQLRFSLAGEERIKDAGTGAYIYSRMVIDYFIDDRWTRAGEVPFNEEVSNATNGGYFLHALPFIDSWDKLDDFRVRLSVQNPDGTEITVFVDGLWLEVETNLEEEIKDEEPVVEKESDEDLRLKSILTDFSSDELPSFEYSYSRERGFVESMASLVTKIFKAGSGISITAVDTRTSIRPRIEHKDDGSFSLKMDTPGFIRPGKHNLRININDNGNEYSHEQEFLWAALLVNTDMSVYKPQENARIAVGAVDDTGQPVCDASISITVKSSLSRIDNFSTRDGTVKRNSECGSGRSNGLPDYYLDYPIPPETGIYSIEVTARTKNGLRTAKKEFEVSDTSEFTIRREFPTVIEPGRYQEAVLRVMSERDFEGVLEERLPLNFDIFREYDESRAAPEVRNEEGGKVIAWKVSLKAGEPLSINYVFSVPDISPAFYLIGPARIGEYAEPRLHELIAGGDDNISVLTPNPPHRCSVKPFLAEAEKGEKINYTIFLKTSSPDNFFMLLPGDLPSEANLILDEFVGRAPGEINAVLDVRPDAKSGSFNYSVIYQEPQNNGRVLSTSCQFNLIIK